MKLIFVTVGNRVVNAVMSVIITNLNVRKCIITIDCFLGIRNVDCIWTFTRYVVCKGRFALWNKCIRNYYMLPISYSSHVIPIKKEKV